jgi:hypothetical protein
MKMKNWKIALFIGVPLLISCGDKSLDDLDTTDNDGNTDSAEPTVPLIEAAAVGFELRTAWDQSTGDLLGWKLSDGSIQDPYVLITLASADYFQSGSDASVETCELFASFEIDETASTFTAEAYNWPNGPGGSGNAAAIWTNASYEGYLEIFGESNETNCANFDQSIFPLGDYLTTFNFMHFGIGLSTLSADVGDWVSLSYDEDSSGTLNDDENAEWLAASGAFMGQYIAINHPASGSYDFVGYDWNYGVAYSYDLETQDTPTDACEDDPATAADESAEQCLIRLDGADDTESFVASSEAGTSVAWITSGARWYEDFPYMDLSILQEGNGITDSQ